MPELSGTKVTISCAVSDPWQDRPYTVRGWCPAGVQPGPELGHAAEEADGDMQGIIFPQTFFLTSLWSSGSLPLSGFIKEIVQCLTRQYSGSMY